MGTTQKFLQAFYLEYFNDYLTVEKMAEHNYLTIKDTQALIDMGRTIHWAKVERDNQKEIYNQEVADFNGG